MFKFGWFSSGRDQAAIDLFNAAREQSERGFIPGAIAYVFCDRAPGETKASDHFQRVVRARGIPLVTYSSRELRRLIRQRPPELAAFRNAFDGRVIELLSGFEVEIVVLAGYMLIMSEWMCRAFLCLNLHPAVPGGPKGTWQEVMWQLMAEGAREAGGMMHLATPELDAGPPVTFFRLPLTGPAWEPRWAEWDRKLKQQGLAAIQAREGEGEPLFARIRAEELRREFPLILLTLKNLAEGSFHLTKAGVEVQGRLLPHGLDLSGQVEAFLP
jgi:phosphoribosylglycinamide formyltransferase 1